MMNDINELKNVITQQGIETRFSIQSQNDSLNKLATAVENLAKQVVITNQNNARLEERLINVVENTDRLERRIDAVEEHQQSTSERSAINKYGITLISSILLIILSSVMAGVFTLLTIKT
jgi:DNA polymerase III alpha subunit (gram-positive type)